MNATAMVTSNLSNDIKFNFFFCFTASTTLLSSYSITLCDEYIPYKIVTIRIGLKLIIIKDNFYVANSTFCPQLSIAL